MQFRSKLKLMFTTYDEKVTVKHQSEVGNRQLKIQSKTFCYQPNLQIKTTTCPTWGDS